MGVLYDHYAMVVLVVYEYCMSGVRSLFEYCVILMRLVCA